MAPVRALLFVAHVHMVVAWMPPVPIAANKLSGGSSLFTRCGPAFSTKQKEGEATRNLFVTRFGMKATSLTLQELFSEHADVLNVNRRHTSNGAYAFVQTSSVEDAIAAKAALHGSGSQSVGSKRLIVRFADDRSKMKDIASMKHSDIIIETARASIMVQGSTKKSASKSANAILEPAVKQKPKAKKAADSVKARAEPSLKHTLAKKTVKPDNQLPTKSKVQQPGKKKGVIANAKGGTELKLQQSATSPAIATLKPPVSIFGDANTPRRDRRRRQEAKFKALKLEHPEIFQQVANKAAAAAAAAVAVAKPKTLILKSTARRSDVHNVFESFMENKVASDSKTHAPSNARKVNKKSKAAVRATTPEVGNKKQPTAVVAATASTSQSSKNRAPAFKSSNQPLAGSTESSNKSQGKAKATASATTPAAKAKKFPITSSVPLKGKTSKNARSTAPSPTAETKKAAKEGVRNPKQPKHAASSKATKGEVAKKSDAAAPPPRAKKSVQARKLKSRDEVTSGNSKPEMESLRMLLMEL